MPVKNPKRYFVEIDVRDERNGVLYRVSEYILLHPNQSYCLIESYKWKETSMINMVLVVRNQEVWLRYLIDTINSE